MLPFRHKEEANNNNNKKTVVQREMSVIEGIFMNLEVVSVSHEIACEVVLTSSPGNSKGLQMYKKCRVM